MVATRDRIERGELPWSALASYFTENAVYIDSAWGRFEGLPAIKQFMVDSMMGLDDWRFPEEWTMADGDRVVSMWWNQLPGTEQMGRPTASPASPFCAMQTTVSSITSTTSSTCSRSWMPSLRAAGSRRGR